MTPCAPSLAGKYKEGCSRRARTGTRLCRQHQHKEEEQAEGGKGTSVAAGRELKEAEEEEELVQRELINK